MTVPARFGETTDSRLVLFGGLYFAQGVPWGFVTVALVLRLTGLGIGAAEVGVIVATALLPWTWKFLLGPVVDSLALVRGGRRRPLLLASEGAMALALIALAFADLRQERGLFLALVFLGSMCAAAQDVLTDALAIAILPQEERGRANGVMSAAKYAGVLVGSTGLTLLAGQVGWPATYAAAAALLLVPATAVMILKEPQTRPAPLGPALRTLGRQVLQAFTQPTSLLAAPFLLVAGASTNFLYPLVMTRLRLGLKLTDNQMSMLVSLGVGTSIAGTLLGGLLADRLGRRRAIAAGAVGLALSHLAFAAMTPSVTNLIVYQVGAGVTAGVLYAATVAFCMDLTNPRSPATHFQVFVSLLSVRLMWATYAGGRLADGTQQTTMFVLAAVIELVPLAVLLAIDPRRAAAAFRRADEANR